MGSPFHLIIFPERAILGIALLCSFWASSLFGDKVTQSVIVASIEGEVSSLNLIDDFKVNMSSSYVGKKISPKTILTTGKTGKVSLLFSNGTLITIKPGSRFYLRKYKQLEAVVEDLVPPGKLEEEPTKSELSAHLDFGDLIVKAPKLKKGSSMNLSSPIGTAGIRGTMFQFMAVRNPVTGDIMGGINLVSGDIDFTDTDGNTVTILSGQSIQLATSKLGESVASQTGELVDLSSTYGPALTQEGALPPPISSIFPNLNLSGDSDAEGSGEEGSFDEPIVVGPSTGDLDFIHEIASEVFFAIEESEQVSSDFTFESIQMAPPVEAPLPEVEAPSAPAAVIGETVAGGNIDRFLGLPPNLRLRGGSVDPLFNVSSDGNRIVAELRSPDDFPSASDYIDVWNNLDPGVNARDFLDTNIEDIVVVSNIPNLLLSNSETADQDAPPIGQSVVYNVVYQVADFRNSSASISREVEVLATRPTIISIPPLADRYPYTDPDGLFQAWISQIEVVDVRGIALNYSATPAKNSYYLEGIDANEVVHERNSINDFHIVAQDWRGLTVSSDTLQLNVTAIPPSFTDLTDGIISVELSGEPLNSIKPQILGSDEFNESIDQESITLVAVTSPDGFPPVDPDDRIDSLANQTYSLTYQIVDSRGEITTLERSLNITATPPSFLDKNGVKDRGIPFESNATWLSQDAHLEFTDPLNELKGWIDSQVAIDFNGTSVEVSPSILSFESGNIPAFTTPYKDLPVGEYRISFIAKDPRYLVPANPVWEDYLTTEYIASLTIVATKPKIEISNGGWRKGLTFDPESGLIEYLVKPTDEYFSEYDDSDDGDFSLFAGEGNQSRAVYIKATAFDGEDISNLLLINDINITVGSTFGVNYSGEVGAETILEVFIDDSSYRQISTGGETENVSFAIRLVDTLGPFLKIPISSKPFEIEGTRELAFPFPRIEIIDNKYSQSEIESYLEVNQSSDASLFPAGFINFDYPEKAFMIDSNLPGTAIGGILAYSGYYEGYITISGIQDPQGNDSRNSVQLDVNVTDNSPPTINLLSGANYFVDLSQTSNYKGNNLANSAEGSRFEDPGVQIVENLFVHEPGESSIQSSSGRVITDLISELEKADERYSVIVQAYLKDQNNTLDDTILSGSIQDILENYDSETDNYKYKVTYRFTDRAGLSDEVSRIFEFTNDPNAPASVSYTGADYTESGIHYLEADSSSNNQFFPAVNAKTSVSSGDIYAAVTSEVLLLYSESNPQPLPSYYDEDGNYFLPNVVNYFEDGSGSYFLPNGSLDGTEIQKDSEGFPKLIVRFIATNQFGDEIEPYDLEIRIQDTTAPTFLFSQSQIISLEAGQAYNDFDISDLSDNYSDPTLSLKILNQDGIAIEQTTIEEVGFLEVGEYSLVYTATDDFENVFINDRNVTVVDSTAPHIAYVPYPSGEITANSDSLISSNPTLVPPSGLVPTFSSFSKDPYIQDGSDKGGGVFDIVLKYSEANSSLQALGILYNDGSQDSLSESKYTVDPVFVIKYDNYGRKRAWYSAFSLNDSTENPYFQDPGVYVESDSSENFTVTSEITSIIRASETLDLKSFKINYSVVDENGNENSISTARNYIFVDEEKPNLTILPSSDVSTFIVIEAGSSIDDSNLTSGKIWSNNSFSSFDPALDVKVSAWDARDSYLTNSIRRTLFDLADTITDIPYPRVTTSSDIDKTFRLDYNVSDSENNWDSHSSYFIVKDTTAPKIVIKSPSLKEVTIDYEDENYNGSDSVSEENLKNLILSYVSVVDPPHDAEQIATYSWDLSFDPSHEPGKVYPLSSDNDGYKITLKVIDSYDNESESFEELELRVEDTKPPEFTMIGPETIHDFFRYGARPGIANQDLFDDRDVTPEYNGTGFSDGAHRFMLADYNFVDPGIYAEDSSFSLSEYPDFDGDGVGEAHARRKINQGESFPDINDAEVGVIYYKSLLSETTLGDVQNLLESNSTTVMPNVSSKVFYEDGSASELNKKIKEFTILYKVWDGWGNFAEDSRTIYIYESERASADKAFFATPIDHTSLEDNVTSFADLSIVQTDYDGDGVSDFWEMALGTRYDDPQSTPDHNFSNKTSFEALIGANMTELRNRIAQIKDNPEYGLNQFSGYLEFNGTD